MTRRSTLRAKQDPTMAPLRTEGARLCLAAVRRTYAEADRASGEERRRLLREAAVVSEAMRKAEGARV